jgi:hypothetical protein
MNNKKSAIAFSTEIRMSEFKLDGMGRGERYPLCFTFALLPENPYLPFIASCKAEYTAAPTPGNTELQLGNQQEPVGNTELELGVPGSFTPEVLSPNRLQWSFKMTILFKRAGRCLCQLWLSANLRHMLWNLLLRFQSRKPV